MFIHPCTMGRSHLIRPCGGEGFLKDGQEKRPQMASIMRLLSREHQKLDESIFSICNDGMEFSLALHRVTVHRIEGQSHWSASWLKIAKRVSFLKYMKHLSQAYIFRLLPDVHSFVFLITLPRLSGPTLLSLRLSRNGEM
jgi:hypothetical protein